LQLVGLPGRSHSIIFFLPLIFFPPAQTDPLPFYFLSIFHFVFKDAPPPPPPIMLCAVTDRVFNSPPYCPPHVGSFFKDYVSAPRPLSDGNVLCRVCSLFYLTVTPPGFISFLSDFFVPLVSTPFLPVMYLVGAHNFSFPLQSLSVCKTIGFCTDETPFPQCAL